MEVSAIPVSQSIQQQSLSGADSIQPAADSIQPAPDSIQPAAVSIQPATGSIQPAADSIQPAADSIQPAPDSIQPAADSIQPSVPPPTPAGSPNRVKLIQQQLLVLIHSSRCIKREMESNSKMTECHFPYCQIMKDVINHMIVCTAGRSCTVSRCSSSRQIILHWKNCTRLDCPVCMPIKKPLDKQHQFMLCTDTNSLCNSVANVPASQPSEGLIAAEMKRAYYALGLQFSDGSSYLNMQPSHTVAIPREGILSVICRKDIENWERI